MSYAPWQGLQGMTSVIANTSVSLDGYVAGPDQSMDNPIGVRGDDLHQWMMETSAFSANEDEPAGERTADDDMVDDILDGMGAFVMGRNMFGPPSGGEWDESWHGWWGDNPPYHGPVFVLTHYPREPLVMEGGTTFHFVTDGIESAVRQARAAAGERNVSVAGGAQVIQQCLKSGLLDVLTVHVAPVILGGGARLLDDVGEPELEQVRVIGSPKVTHVTYRVKR